ncbi:hypothetical protein, partial [Candidatus Colwellia aromaticivorans]|uniref:hypothetical protein n=1 Tax=Candidatus Colwellia aromaticivorans TaxID=2267621 RepID=UPI001B34EACE
ILCFTYAAPGKFLPISVKVSLLPAINASLQLINVFILALLKEYKAFLKYLWQSNGSGMAVVTYVCCGDLHKIINCCACHVLGIRQPIGQV